MEVEIAITLVGTVVLYTQNTRITRDSIRIQVQEHQLLDMVV